jgi:hypothetical protein
MMEVPLNINPSFSVVSGWSEPFVNDRLSRIWHLFSDRHQLQIKFRQELRTGVFSRCCQGGDIIASAPHVGRG